jgi:hypothetical protein
MARLLKDLLKKIIEGSFFKIGMYIQIVHNFMLNVNQLNLVCTEELPTIEQQWYCFDSKADKDPAYAALSASNDQTANSVGLGSS